MSVSSSSRHRQSRRVGAATGRADPGLRAERDEAPVAARQGLAEAVEVDRDERDLGEGVGEDARTTAEFLHHLRCAARPLGEDDDDVATSERIAYWTEHRFRPCPERSIGMMARMLRASQPTGPGLRK